jgi:hypothetical protein
VQHWNTKEAQANIWFLGGAGGIEGNDFSGTKPIVAPGTCLVSLRVYVLSVAIFLASGFFASVAPLIGT